MFDEQVEKALWVIDVAAGKKTAASPNEWASVVLYSTRVIQLYDIAGKLSNWSKYVYDKSNAILGANAVYRLKAARKDALMRLSSLAPKQLSEIRPLLREDLVGFRIFDFEPELRAAYYTLLNAITRETEMRHYKIALTNPMPLSIISSEPGYMTVMMDKPHLPAETVAEFETEKDAVIFFSNFLTLILYAKQKKMFDAEQIAKDRFASKYAKECYKVFTKSIKKEKHIPIAEAIRAGNLWDAVADLQMEESFYNAFKNLWKATFVSFGFGEMRLTSFVSETTLTIDKYGLEKMADAFEKNKNASKEYLMAVCLLNAAIQDYFFDRRIYLSRELEPVMPSDMGWKLPLSVAMECTADCKPIKPMKDLPASLFGIKNIRIDTADSKFVYFGKAPEDFKVDPINGTIANVMVYTVPDTDFYRGNLFFVPEVLHCLASIAINRILDGRIVAAINSNPGLRKLRFISEDGKNGIAGYLTDYLKTPQKPGRAVQKITKRSKK